MDEDDCECAEGAPAWMATFSDLATLLLTFFVLLLSFAEMDITEFKTMLGSIREAFGVNTLHPGPFHAASTQLIEFSAQASTLKDVINQEERHLLRAIRRYIQKEGLENDVEVLAGSRGVIVRMKDNVLFDTGSASVKVEGLPILDKIRQLALAFPEGLSVEGHTDDRPINTSQFPSNWELSTARATRVLQSLQRREELPLKRLQVVGYADTKPLAPNDSEENRSKNRRVEFVFRRGLPDAISENPTGEPESGEAPDPAEEPDGENSAEDENSAEANDEDEGDPSSLTEDPGDEETATDADGSGEREADTEPANSEEADSEEAAPKPADTESAEDAQPEGATDAEQAPESSEPASEAADESEAPKASKEELR